MWIRESELDETTLHLKRFVLHAPFQTLDEGFGIY